jgi:hypothetical protein
VRTSQSTSVLVSAPGANHSSSSDSVRVQRRIFEAGRFALKKYLTHSVEYAECIHAAWVRRRTGFRFLPLGPFLSGRGSSHHLMFASNIRIGAVCSRNSARRIRYDVVRASTQRATAGGLICIFWRQVISTTTPSISSAFSAEHSNRTRYYTRRTR